MYRMCGKRAYPPPPPIVSARAVPAPLPPTPICVQWRRRTGDPNTTTTPADSYPPSFIREQDTRDKHPQPPLPFAHKGSGGTRCSMGQDMDTRHGMAWGKARATPLPPSQPGTARNASGDATAPLPVCARGDENGRASTPLAPRRRLHVGSARMGGTLQPGAAPPSPRVGVRGQRANRNAQKRRPSPRARIGDHAEAPPSPRHTSPEAPPYALQGCTGRVVHDRAARPGAPPSFAHRGDTHTRAALVCKAETGTAGQGQDPTPPFAQERGSRTGRVRANPERCPLSLLHRSDARTGGVGLGRGVCNRVRTRERGVGCAPPLRRPLRGTEGRGARTQAAACGGLYGMECK
ncbi:hypothetical protein EDB84DRAFT_1677144 [Lactarius hengduanensis]|nr:hypothetical protein EDB84DRAFT_1677144 [Lactarius hengduanensis]